MYLVGQVYHICMYEYEKQAVIMKSIYIFTFLVAVTSINK